MTVLRTSRWHEDTRRTERSEDVVQTGHKDMGSTVAPRAGCTPPPPIVTVKKRTPLTVQDKRKQSRGSRDRSPRHRGAVSPPLGSIHLCMAPCSRHSGLSSEDPSCVSF